jgi:nucleoside-diphosphate-sugar epimerase
VRVLVTGAAGFIGSHVVRDLVAHGHEPVALVRRETSLWRIEDIRDSISVVETLNGVRPDACIHLAWYAVPGRYLDAGHENIASLEASLALLDDLSAAGCAHVVMAGTCAEYDTESGLLREDSPTRPVTVYAACKLACAVIGAIRAQQLGIGFSWARLFYLYGPYEDGRRLVPALINAVLDGREFAATTGTQVRDYLHVADVARGLCALAEGRHGGTFNVCSGYPVLMRDLIALAARLAGDEGLVKFGALEPRAWEPASILGDSSHLRDLAGWAPSFSLADGLRNTVDWWKHRRAAVGAVQ